MTEQPNHHDKDDATVVAPQPKVLRNKGGYQVATLQKEIASGAFGRIFLGNLTNPLQVLAERIVLGEEEPRWLVDLPSQHEELKDAGLVAKVYASAEKHWQEILALAEKGARGEQKAAEQYEIITNLIDPTLFKDNTIAVKVLHDTPQVKTDKADLNAIMHETRKRFRKESQLLRRFEYPDDHPNIVRRFGYVTDPDLGGCLLLEYIEGETLEHYLDAQEDRRLQPKTAVRLTLQLAEAVKHIHSKEIIHRDLNPKNIVLKKEKDGIIPVIVDFGVSKDKENLQTMEGMTVGTVRYMSPEQARESAKVDERTDVYALTTILFEMITGDLAYPYKTQKEAFEKLLEPEHPTRVSQYIRNISPEFRRVIEAGRAKTHEDRLTLEQFTQELTHIHNDGRYYRAFPHSHRSSTFIKRRLERIDLIGKKLATDKPELETELRYRNFEERIIGIDAFLAGGKWDEAKTELNKFAEEVKPLHEGYDDIRERLKTLEGTAQIGIAYQRVEQSLAKAEISFKDDDYPLVGEALDTIQPIITVLPKEKYKDVYERYARLSTAFEPHKPVVGAYMVVKKAVDEVAHFLTTEQSLSLEQIVKQQEKLAAAQSVLPPNANMIGHKPYEQITARIAELYTALNSTQMKTNSPEQPISSEKKL